MNRIQILTDIWQLGKSDTRYPVCLDNLDNRLNIRLVMHKFCLPFLYLASGILHGRNIKGRIIREAGTATTH